MHSYNHGGEIYDKDISLDMSINVNPFGMPTSVKEVLINTMEDYSLYPDDTCSELRRELSNFHQVKKEYIQCGNGAADIIYRLCFALKPENAMVLAPTFSEYEAALTICGTHVRRMYLSKENGFRLTKEQVTQIPSDLQVLFLCNPNNPVGNLIEVEVMDSIIKHCNTHQITLVVDECFMEFTGKEKRHSLIGMCGSMPNLFIVKAFTKIYAMAGLRLGYGITSNVALLEKMKQVGPPWNVSTPAQVAGCVALKEEEYRRNTIQYITKQRAYLVAGLRNLGFVTLESETNYILFEAEEALYKQLIARKVLIRQCGNYYGLSNEFYRTAVRTAEENQVLLDTIRQCREEAGK